MSLTIESASVILYRLYNSCEERNDKICAEAIGVALECMRKIEEQKLSDYIIKEEKEDIIMAEIKLSTKFYSGKDVHDLIIRHLSNDYRAALAAIRELSNIPAADVRPMLRAQWEICSDGYYPYCSNCKQEPQGRVMTDYCPNCGADMRGRRT